MNEELLCTDCGRTKDNPIHFDSPTKSWGAALHWFKSPKRDASIIAIGTNNPELKNQCPYHIREIGSVGVLRCQEEFGHETPHRPVQRPVNKIVTEGEWKLLEEFEDFK